MISKNSQDSLPASALDASLASAKGTLQQLRVGDADLEALREAATALRMQQEENARARIPLEQVERELARVMHIELALLLFRARDLILHAAGSGTEVIALAFALQAQLRESIDVARACGVRVPRVILRLVDGDRSTWPCAARLERWARRLDPDVDLGPTAHETAAP